MIFHASKTTFITTSQTDSAIDSGRTVKVLGILVEGTSNGQVVIEKFGTATVIMNISVLANSSSVVDIPWVADAGLQVTTPSGVTCTVFHTQAL